MVSARKAGDEICELCSSMGGTITGEHGVGLEKLHAMFTQFSSADLSTMRRVKEVFDPVGILNPGKLLPPEEDESLHETKEVAG